MQLDNIKTYSARKLINVPYLELGKILQGVFYLQFDDGVLLTTGRETAFSSIFWEFHRRYPEMAILKEHHLRNFMGKFSYDNGNWETEKYFNSKSHNEIGNTIYWEAHRVRNRNRIHRFDSELNELYFNCVNHAYNFLASLHGYEISFSFREFLEIRFHPEFVAIKATITRDPRTISAANKAALILVKTHPDFRNNSLAKSVRAGMLKDMQFLQCVLTRGWIEDIDNNIFKEPIYNAFIDGLTQYENFIESRAASKSLLYNKKVIQFVEYFSRTLQLQAMYVKNLHKGDCGSQAYMRWTIRPALVNSATGRQTRDTDLKTFEGKYYKEHPDDVGLKVITSSDTHLIGKTLLVRSAIAGCRHPDPHGICSVCFGMLAPSFDHHNLGQQCGAKIAEGQTQTVLSQKHHQASSVADAVVIPESSTNILTTNKDQDSYMIHPSLMGKRFSVILSKADCPGLIDLEYVKSVSELGSISHVSEMEHATFVITNDNFEDRYTVLVSQDSRRSSLSFEMLEYIKRHKPLVKEDNYEIDMSQWKFKAPFSTMPLTQESPYIRANKIKSLVIGDSKNAKERDTPDAPKALLQRLYDLINANGEQSINIALLEVVVYSLMIKNSTTRDYFLPKEGDRMGIAANSHIMSERSAAGTMAFEDHAAVILHPNSYVPRPRLDHTYDVLIRPQEHLECYDPEVFTSNM